MPLLVPLSDLIGLSRQVTVLAYQYGAGLCELVTPTNGALMAMLAASGVPLSRNGSDFVVPVLGALAALAALRSAWRWQRVCSERSSARRTRRSGSPGP